MTDTDQIPPDGDPADLDPVDSDLEIMTKAVLFAMLTANEQPYPIPVPAARNVARRLIECGVQQTGDTAAEIELPGWVTERVREAATPVPVEPDHHAMQDTDRVTVAPAEPTRIAKKYMGVVEDGEL